MSEVIAGIDPSTSTGVCILSDGEVVHLDALKIKQKGWDNGRVYAYFSDALRALLIEHGVHVMAVEKKVPAGQIASQAHIHDLGTNLYGRCEELASRLNCELMGVAIISWRSTFLRTTAAPKNFPVPDHILPTRHKEYQIAERKKWWKRKAISECERRGIAVKNHDIAEAVGIAMHAYSLRNPLGWSKANDLFDGLSKTTPDRPAGTLTLKNDARSEADRVFEKFE